jgi:hypothetical protein
MPEAASKIVHNRCIMKTQKKIQFNSKAHQLFSTSNPDFTFDLDLNTKISLTFYSKKSMQYKKYFSFFQVRDISGTFRWAPFLALQSSDSFLTMLLLLSKHSVRCLPVVDFGEGKLVNIITQSAVVHMLAECAGFDWFDDWGNKRLAEVGLPSIDPDKLVKVSCYNLQY